MFIRLLILIFLYTFIDLNSLDVRPPESRVIITGDTTKELRVTVEPSYADNVLVVGPRYQTEDMKCIWTTHLGMRVSGVCGKYNFPGVFSYSYLYNYCF